MEVVSKSKQFETLKQSLVRLRNDASIVVEEKEENLTPREKEAPKIPFNAISSQQNSAEGESDNFSLLFKAVLLTDLLCCCDVVFVVSHT